MADGDHINILPGDLSFHSVCRFLSALQRFKTKRDAKKSIIESFYKSVWRESGQAFDVFRLILPQCDKERGNYNIKDIKLVDIILRTCGEDPKGPRAVKAKSYKNPLHGEGAGDFVKFMEQEIFSKYCGVPNPTADRDADLPLQHLAQLKQVKIRDVNAKLDELAAHAGSKEEQAKVIRWFINRCAPLHLSWLMQIILKNMKIGTGEVKLLSAWHPDANDYYNNTGMDLKAVFNQMTDRDKPFRSDIVPGKVVRPQLALPMLSTLDCFMAMHTASGQLRPFVVETKFDGERIQIHRFVDPLTEETKIQYYSRKGIEHGASRGLYDIFDQAVTAATGGHERVILDGELLVWNKKRHVFEPFGGLKAAAAACRDNKSGDEILDVRNFDGSELFDDQDPEYTPPFLKDVEIVYACFDLLYLDDASIIHKTLSERQRFMKESLKEVSVPLRCGTISGRVVPILPGETRFAGKLCSRLASTEQEIKQQLEAAAAYKEEGIMVKALDSVWSSNDRSGVWLKIKPDYVSNYDLDCVIIGGFYGRGSRGGMVSMWLLGLQANSGSSATATATEEGCPAMWVSFGRVGSGNSDEERVHLNELLKDNFSTDVAHPPKCLKLSGREKPPDVWIKDPSKSVVLTISADIRLIRSRQYATKYSLRFPRIQAVRDDKDPLDVDTEERVMADIERTSGKIPMGAEGEGEYPQGVVRKRAKRQESTAANKRKKVGQVPEFMRPVDTSTVNTESNAFKNCIFHFVNYALDVPKVKAEQAVVRLGGKVSQSWIPKVTHIVAAKDNQMTKKHVDKDRDVLSMDWFKRCIEKGKLEEASPKDYINMSAETRQSCVDYDEFGDSYIAPVDGADIAALLTHIKRDQLDATNIAEGLLGRKLNVGEDAVDALQAYLDAQQAQQGVLDPATSLFRGCTVLFLHFTSSGSSAAVSSPKKSHGGRLDHVLSAVRTAESVATAGKSVLSDLCLQQLRLRVGLHGGAVTQTYGPQVTHIVGFIDPRTKPKTDNTSTMTATTGAGNERTAAARTVVTSMTDVYEVGVTGDMVLRAIKEQAGGEAAVRALHLMMHAAAGGGDLGVKFVTVKWVEESLEILDAQQAQRAHEAGYPLLLNGAEDLSSWPWSNYLPKSKSPPAPSPGSIPLHHKGGRAAPAGGDIEKVVRRRGKATLTGPAPTPKAGTAAAGSTGNKPLKKGGATSESGISTGGLSESEHTAATDTKPRSTTRAVPVHSPPMVKGRGKAQQIKSHTAAATAAPGDHQMKEEDNGGGDVMQVDEKPLVPAPTVVAPTTRTTMAGGGGTAPLVEEPGASMGLFEQLFGPLPPVEQPTSALLPAEKPAPVAPVDLPLPAPSPSPVLPSAGPPSLNKPVAASYLMSPTMHPPPPPPPAAALPAPAPAALPVGSKTPLREKMRRIKERQLQAQRETS